MKRRSPLDPAQPSSVANGPRLVMLVGIIALCLALVVVATIGLLMGPPAQEDTPMVGRHEGTANPPASTGQARPEPELPKVARTNDAERFARSAAQAIFSWETRDGFQPREYVEALLQAGDADSGELNGLVQDLTAYLPTPEAWVELQKYETSQSLTIDRLRVPDQWHDVLDQAREGTILPGTIAYTVEGTRHRSGVWEGEVVSTEHPVTFSLFITCAPTYESCRLQRLTALDQPLR